MHGHAKVSCAPKGELPDAAGVTTQAMRFDQRKGPLSIAARGAAGDDDAVAVSAHMTDLNEPSHRVRTRLLVAMSHSRYRIVL